MIGYFLNEGPVTNFEEANKSNLELFSQMYREWLKKVYSYHLLNLREHSYLQRHSKEDIEKQSKHLILL